MFFPTPIHPNRASQNIKYIFQAVLQHNVSMCIFINITPGYFKLMPDNMHVLQKVNNNYLPFYFNTAVAAIYVLNIPSSL